MSNEYCGWIVSESASGVWYAKEKGDFVEFAFPSRELAYAFIEDADEVNELLRPEYC